MEIVVIRLELVHNLESFILYIKFSTWGKLILADGTS